MQCPSCGHQLHVQYLDLSNTLDEDKFKDELAELTYGAAVTVTLADGVEQSGWLLTEAKHKKRLICLVGSNPVITYGAGGNKKHVSRVKVKKRTGFTLQQAQFYQKMRTGTFNLPTVVDEDHIFVDEDQKREADEFIQKTKSKKRSSDIIVQTHFRFPLLKKDIGTLRPKEELNDSIINFYLMMMLMAHHDKLYCFNTFFYRKLFKDFEYNYDNVSTWGKKLDLFDKDIILVPVHRDNHWTLISVVFGKPGTITYYDSMHNNGMADTEAMKQYILDEWATRGGKKEEQPDLLLRGTDMSCPKQDNLIDCGVFLCFFALCQTFNLSVGYFSQKDVGMFRSHIALCTKQSCLANFVEYPPTDAQPTRKSPRKRQPDNDGRTPVRKRTRHGRKLQLIDKGAVGSRTRSKNVPLVAIASSKSKSKSKTKKVTRQARASPFKSFLPSNPDDPNLDSIQTALRSVKNGGMLPDDMKNTVKTDDGTAYPGFDEVVRVLKMKGCDQFYRRLQATPDKVLTQLASQSSMRWRELFQALAFGGIFGYTVQNRLQLLGPSITAPDRFCFRKSFLKTAEEYKHSNIRALRTAGGRTPKEHQPFASIEPDIVMAPSGISAGGLGLFALRNFKEGEVVALYSGRCMKCVEGNTSAYLIEAQWFNKETKSYETWFLDSCDPQNAAGRGVNDACSGYTDREYRENPHLSASGYSQAELMVIPAKYHTNFRNNVAYRPTMKQNKHPVIGKWYLEMYALFDIEKNEEFFGKYQIQYWERVIDHYSKFHSPNIITGKHYEKSMKDC